MILSFFYDEWSFTNMFFLWIGTTLLFAALVAAWSVIRKERIDAMYLTNKVHTPDEIFEAIGAEVKEKLENKDYTQSNYMIAYQGGYFGFIFTEDSRWVTLLFMHLNVLNMNISIRL